MTTLSKIRAGPPQTSNSERVGVRFLDSVCIFGRLAAPSPSPQATQPGGKDSHPGQTRETYFVAHQGEEQTHIQGKTRAPQNLFLTQPGGNDLYPGRNTHPAPTTCDPDVTHPGGKNSHPG